MIISSPSMLSQRVPEARGALSQNGYGLLMIMGASAQVATAMAGLTGDACPAWEEELYKVRVCQSYTCNSCGQEWCHNLCHKLKIEFGACNKQVTCPPPADAPTSAEMPEKGF